MIDRPRVTASYDVVDVRSVSRERLVHLLQISFGPGKTAEQVTWKHVEGPWGPSRGWAAVDGDVLLGARLIVPWRLTVGGTTYSASRAMDGAVSPAARGRGVFSALVKREMAELAGRRSWHVLYSTSVPASREAYRKLGWTIFAAQPTVLSLTVPRRPALLETIDPGSVVPRPGPGRVGTAWDERSLRWRSDPRSGLRYEAVGLRHGDGRLLYRRTRLRGVPVLVATAMTGEDDRGALLGAACARARCAAVLLPATAPVPGRRPTVGAGTTVSLWQQSGPDAPVDATDQTRWAFTGADLEGVL